MVSKLGLVLSWWPRTCLSSPGMDTAGGMGQLDGELAPWATRAAGLKQVCLCCLAALICFPSACLLAWQALRRLQTTCCTCAPATSTRPVRQHCWYCCTFEIMLAMAVVRAHGLSALIRTPVALRTDGNTRLGGLVPGDAWIPVVSVDRIRRQLPPSLRIRRHSQAKSTYP